MNTGVVIDCGCYWHPDHQGASQDSIAALIRRFEPRVLRGFDPHPQMPDHSSYQQDGTRVDLWRRAVWTWDGEVSWIASPDAPLSARVNDDTNPGLAAVKCADIAHVIRGFFPAVGLGERLIVKLDVEGAEYALLRHLIRTDTIRYVDRLLVEWHDLDNATREEERDELLHRLPCPVEDWA